MTIIPIPDALVAGYKKRLFWYYIKIFLIGKLPYWLFKCIRSPEEPKPPFPIEESNGMILQEYLSLNFSAHLARRWLEHVAYAQKIRSAKEKEETRSL